MFTLGGGGYFRAGIDSLGEILEGQNVAALANIKAYTALPTHTAALPTPLFFAKGKFHHLRQRQNFLVKVSLPKIIPHPRLYPY